MLVLALQSFDTVTLIAGNAIAQLGVDFLFTDLFMQRLGAQPIFGAIDSMAAHRDGYSPRWSCTMRTARS